MNVFEDLIVELQQANLLESSDPETGPAVEFQTAQTDEHAADTQDAGDLSGVDADNDAAPSSADEIEAVLVTDSPAETPVSASVGNDANKKRAVSEVSSLQMVEHVLTGVEREYLKIVPKTFDDFKAKKSLHTFLNAAETASPEEHAAAEFSLLQETEAWCTALGERDRNIPVSSLRLYCENSRPALSSQALVGLARFYRNLPYSEQLRSKFDFTITRLFSRAIEGETRVCLFERDDMLNHINTLYKEWASIPLYTADDDDSKVLLTALSFDELASEAEQASTFDQLITSDFFTRLRLFKESISELFFAPSVTAAAIECNIRVGNAYVKLIHLEREKMNEESIESKYGDLNEQAVSDAAARTLQLVDLLRGPVVDPEDEDEAGEEPVIQQDEPPKAAPAPVITEKPAKEMPPFVSRLLNNAASVNKWFLAAAVLLIAASIGVWVWANYVSEVPVTSTGVEVIEVQGTFMNEYVKTARVSSGTFYGVLLPAWESLPKEKRQEFVQRVQQAGASKSYTDVNLIGKNGRIAAYASPTRVEVNMP